MRETGQLAALLLLALSAVATTARGEEDAARAAQSAQVAQIRQWLSEMKQLPRGPFDRVRYFCKDGKVLDPKPYACEPYGGGYQHGEWSARTRQIRAAGYPVANLLVMVQPQQIVGPSAEPDLLPVLILERFLIAYDDGWIFRRAASYRGAIQDHNEKEAAREILLALSAGSMPFVMLREAARAFAHGKDTPSLTKVRGLASVLDEKDPRFHPLRSRIHNAPEADDAARVRAYASSSSADPRLQAEYAAMAAAIDEAFRPQPLSAALAGLRRSMRQPEARAALDALIGRVAAAEKPGAPIDLRLRDTASALVWLQDTAAAAWLTPAGRLAVIDASLNAESAFLVTASQAGAASAGLTREQRLQWLGHAAAALHGLGLLDPREAAELQQGLADLTGKVELAEYRAGVEYLERAAAWASRRLEYHFGGGIQRLAPVEPLVAGFVPDRLRASPLLFYSGLLQGLREDVDRVSGVEQRVFGEAAGGGLRRLNPGIARGVLRASTAAATAGGAPAIYLVPETVSDLPPAAGILTEAEGNPVSHVQLLARNLGIPNVVVSRELLPRIAAHDGRRIVLAASTGGLVEIADDGPQWDAVFGRSGPSGGVTIVPDLAKLDLLNTGFVSTAQLRASDSGRIVGPKAAHVGELSHRFPDNVSSGLAVTFGVYRELLREPVRENGPPMFDWMKQQYADIAVRRGLDPEGHAQRVSGFLGFVRGWFARQPLSPALLDRLRGAMLERFGLEGTYGVFVRSDTNIEDLPGFTGAGLNKTVPNAVGFDDTVEALRQVWASPFTERAYGWRQDLMDQPEHVYVSVLLHQSIPNDKSGVMITADVDTGDLDTLTVAVSLGVGGGVDGEASESLRIDARSGKAQLLASATARLQRRLLPTGGAELVPAPAPQAVLSQDEIEALAGFARQLPEAYPELQDAEGERTPADVEFGFVDGRLTLQQIRPFLQNRAAARQEYLARMDAQLRRKDDAKVDLGEPPEQRP